MAWRYYGPVLITLLAVACTGTVPTEATEDNHRYLHEHAVLILERIGDDIAERSTTVPVYHHNYSGEGHRAELVIENQTDRVLRVYLPWQDTDTLLQDLTLTSAILPPFQRPVVYFSGASLTSAVRNDREVGPIDLWLCDSDGSDCYYQYSLLLSPVRYERRTNYFDYLVFLVVLLVAAFILVGAWIYFKSFFKPGGASFRKVLYNYSQYKREEQELLKKYKTQKGYTASYKDRLAMAQEELDKQEGRIEQLEATLRERDESIALLGENYRDLREDYDLLEEAKKNLEYNRNEGLKDLKELRDTINLIVESRIDSVGGIRELNELLRNTPEYDINFQIDKWKKQIAKGYEERVINSLLEQEKLFNQAEYSKLISLSSDWQRLKRENPNSPRLGQLRIELLAILDNLKSYNR